MKWIRKVLILTHRYLGICLGLLFFVWFASGIGMVFAGGMPRLDPATRLERMPALDLGRINVTPSEAATKAGLRRSPGRILLFTLMDRPAYRFGAGGSSTVFADDGDTLPDVDERASLAIAARFANVPLSALHHVAVLDAPDQWTIDQRRQMPLHKIAVDDGAGTVLYVSGDTAEVVMRTTRRTRALAWVAAIPHWLYFVPLRLNAQLWTRVVVWTSLLGTASVAIGLVLAATQYRVKYNGWMKWHYWTGVVFGVFALTWVVSGYLSMETIQWFSDSSGGGARIPLSLSGGALDVSAFPTIDAAAWQRALGERAGRVKEIEYRRVQGDAYFVLNGLGARSVLLSAATLEPRRAPFALDSIMERMQDGYNAPIADSQVLDHYDAYYYDRDREAPLPVIRVQFGDADQTWVYVDGNSQMVARFTRRQRIERWVYHGLHSLDFSFWYYSRWWDVGVIALLLGGTSLSAIGVVIGLRRLRRSVTRRRTTKKGDAEASPLSASNPAES